MTKLNSKSVISSKVIVDNLRVASFRLKTMMQENTAQVVMLNSMELPIV